VNNAVISELIEFNSRDLGSLR